MSYARSDAILLIDRGDLPSLAAAMIQPDRRRLVVWHLAEEMPSSARRLQAAREHAELLGAPLVVSEAWQPPAVVGRESEALWSSLVLMQAAIVARQQGCAKIVDPVQVGLRPGLVCQAVDRGTTVTDLILLEEAGERSERAPGGGSLVIDLPLVDLEDDQILDLVDDAGGPLDAWWPCLRGEPDPCGVCGGCQRWRLAFDTRRLGWPWTRSPEPATESSA